MWPTDFQRTTIADVKAKLADCTGLPADQQRLVYLGQELEDQHVLGHYGIANHSCIHLVEKGQGEDPPDCNVGKREQYHDLSTNIAAEVEKHRNAFAQAVDRDCLAAQALGWCQGLAPGYERAYYFHPDRPTEVVFSVDDVRALLDSRASMLREAELEKLAAEYGMLFVDIERCISLRAKHTVEQEHAEARWLASAAAAAASFAAAIPSAEEASRSEKADALEVQASEARHSAAFSHAEAKKAAKAGDFAAAVVLKAKAVEAQKCASELDEQVLQCRAEAAERMMSARATAKAEAEAKFAHVAARRGIFYLPATLEERCVAEVARLQACRDCSIEAADYEAAEQANDKAMAYASLVPKLQGLAWMQWRSEDMQAAKVREEVEMLRQKLAEAKAKIEAQAKLREEV